MAWLHIRLQNGTFLMRMEDLDTPRVVAGSAEKILHDLQWLGLDWDGPVVYQSERRNLYQAALDELSARNLVYPCFCSRKDIQAAASAPHGKLGVYPGTCAKLSEEQRVEKAKHKNPAVRVRVNQALSEECGDFVIKRADNLFAYQLAVVVDDLEQQINQVVRGADLMDSTQRQQYLAGLLASDRAPIEYFHVPLLLDENGRRMSKRDGSKSVSEWRQEGKSAEQLIAYLAFSLGLIDSEQPLDAGELLNRVTMQQLSSILL